MTRLWHWVLFEVLTALASCAGLFGCIVASKQIFSALPKDNPILFVLEGIGGILLSALGVGFVFSLSFIIMMALEINKEVRQEELEDETK